MSALRASLPLIQQAIAGAVQPQQQAQQAQQQQQAQMLAPQAAAPSAAPQGGRPYGSHELAWRDCQIACL